MARTPYQDPEAEDTYQQMASATQKLSDDMKVDAYTGGVMSTAAGSQAQSIADQVRKRK